MNLFWNNTKYTSTITRRCKLHQICKSRTNGNSLTTFQHSDLHILLLDLVGESLLQLEPLLLLLLDLTAQSTDLLLQLNDFLGSRLVGGWGIRGWNLDQLQLPLAVVLKWMSKYGYGWTRFSNRVSEVFTWTILEILNLLSVFGLRQSSFVQFWVELDPQT